MSLPQNSCVETKKRSRRIPRLASLLPYFTCNVLIQSQVLSAIPNVAEGSVLVLILAPCQKVQYHISQNSSTLEKVTTPLCASVSPCGTMRRLKHSRWLLGGPCHPQGLELSLAYQTLEAASSGRLTFY